MRRRLSFVSVRGQVGTLSLGLAVFVAILSGCASMDPTEQSFGIEFANNLAHAVVLKACGDDACRSFTDTWHLRAGARASDNISDRRVISRWIAEEPSGGVIGCLPLSFDAKYAQVVVRLTQTVPCPGHQALPLRAIHHGKRLGGET
jgi:hypothetical protein